VIDDIEILGWYKGIGSFGDRVQVTGMAETDREICEAYSVFGIGGIYRWMSSPNNEVRQ